MGLAAMGLLLAACAAPTSRGEFAPLRPLQPDTLEHNGWDRDSDLLHVDLDLRVDFEAKRVAGVVRNRLRALVDDTRVITLHAAEMEIADVSDSGGRKLVWEYQSPLLQVQLARALERGEEECLRVEYSCAPESGLYFRESSKDFDGFAPQVWSQGQEEDNRYWFPTWDYPSDRASFSGHFRVDQDMHALSNGKLLSVDDHGDGQRTFHWELTSTIPTYLIALAAGRWERYSDSWRGVEVEYWVAPGTGEEKARRAFGETPAMLEYFTELLAVDYPYEKYAQVAVADFVTGGMENASLTIQNDYIIADAGEALELEGDPRLLVAHELAHQWFGDLVTCFGWSHLWLNEAWASYLELLFERHVAGDASFAIWLERYREDYIQRGARCVWPLAEDWRAQVTEKRCHHEYVKGPWVLHMLERRIGSDAFWQATHDYLVRHAETLVTTEDFSRAVFDSTGRNIEGFIEQWVEGGGHPAYQVSFEAVGQTLRLDVRQAQETTELVPLFDVEVAVDLHDVHGGVQRFELRVNEARHSFELPLNAPLVDLVFDADCSVLCELELTKGAGMWAHQASLDHAGLRWRALGPLDLARRGGDREAGAALAQIAAEDPEALLRRRALRYCTRAGDTPFLLSRLLSSPFEEDALARQTALRLLARQVRDLETIEALEERLADDPAPSVRAIIESMGRGVRNSKVGRE